MERKIGEQTQEIHAETQKQEKLPEVPKQVFQKSSRSKSIENVRKQRKGKSSRAISFQGTKNPKIRKPTRQNERDFENQNQPRKNSIKAYQIKRYFNYLKKEN